MWLLEIYNGEKTTVHEISGDQTAVSIAKRRAKEAFKEGLLCGRAGNIQFFHVMTCPKKGECHRCGEQELHVTPIEPDNYPEM